MSEETALQEQSIAVYTVASVPISKVVDFMKGIAADDLWEEAERHVREAGHTHVLVSLEPAYTVMKLVEHKLSRGEELSRHTREMPLCASHTPAAGGGPPPRTPGRR